MSCSTDTPRVEGSDDGDVSDDVDRQPRRSKRFPGFGTAFGILTGTLLFLLIVVVAQSQTGCVVSLNGILCKKSPSTAEGRGYPGLKYMVTFGDSYSSSGFNISSTKPSAANPLGNPELPGWTTSGGLNWVGFTVTEFNSSLLLGYNFAQGGATVDSTLVQPIFWTIPCVKDQVADFIDNMGSKPSFAPWRADDTVVAIWIGINDIGNSYLRPNAFAIYRRVVARYFEILQDLYDVGLRKFILLSIPPTNKSPLMAQQPPSFQALLIQALEYFNHLLLTGHGEFKTEHPDVTSMLVNTSVPFHKALEDPTKYGAPDATCFNNDGKSCLWFDTYHPGLAIQRLVADAIAEEWLKLVQQGDLSNGRSSSSDRYPDEYLFDL